MKIKSVFNQGEKIPTKYTADGEDINPPLEISEISSNAKSLVLIVDDPDAPRGTWVHWVVVNIPVFGNFLKIEENSVPRRAIQLANSAGGKDYHGPAPPSGTHRYLFKIYALDISDLGLGEDAEKSDVLNAMEEHVLDKAELIGTYTQDRLSQSSFFTLF